MSKVVIVTCSRCGGSGHSSFNLTRGTVCFGCNGSGSVLTTDAKITIAKKAKIKAAAKKELEKEIMLTRIESYNIALVARAAKYKNDPRLGPKTKARCEEFPAVGDQTYLTLEMFDSGKILHNIRDLAQ